MCIEKKRRAEMHSLVKRGLVKTQTFTMSSTTFCGMKLIVYMACAVLAFNCGDTFSVEGVGPE